jgi:hypothetical protein
MESFRDGKTLMHRLGSSLGRLPMKPATVFVIASLLLGALAGCTSDTPDGGSPGASNGNAPNQGAGATGTPAGPASVKPSGMVSVFADDPDTRFGVALVANSDPSRLRYGLMRFPLPASSLTCSSPTAVLKALPAEDVGDLDLVATLNTFQDDSWNQETLTWNSFDASKKGPEIARQTIPAYVSGRDRTITWTLGPEWIPAATDGALSLVLGHDKAQPSDVYYQVRLTTSTAEYQGAYLPTLTLSCGAA